MNRFQKIVALDRTGLNRWGEQACQTLAETCVFYQDIPQTDQEKICLLYTSGLNTGQQVEIISGLDAGDQVVLN